MIHDSFMILFKYDTERYVVPNNGLDVVSKDWKQLENFSEQTEEMCLIACRQDICAFINVIDKTEKLCNYVCKKKRIYVKIY